MKLDAKGKLEALNRQVVLDCAVVFAGNREQTKLCAEGLMLDKAAERLFEDGRRKHSHWQVTISYGDNQKFARVYTDRAKAKRFAERQKKCPVVRSTRITQVA